MKKINLAYASFVNFWFPKIEYEIENYELFRIVYFILLILLFLIYPRFELTYFDDIFYYPVYLFKPFSLFHSDSNFYYYSRLGFFVFAIFSALGFLTSLSMKLCTFFMFLSLAAWQNYGSYHQFTNIVVTSTLVISLSSCGHLFSIDHLLSKKYKKYPFRSGNFFAGKYTWPLQFFKFYWSYIFFTSVLCKFGFGGPTFINSNVLGALFIKESTFYPDVYHRTGYFSVVLRNFITDHYWVGRLGTIGALVLEFAMPLILFYNKTTKYLVSLGVTMFLLVYITMGHRFLLSTFPFVVAIIFLDVNLGKKLMEFKISRKLRK